MFTEYASERSTDAHETALECLEAGVSATLPERVVDRTVSLSSEDDTLRVRGTTYDLAEYDRILIVGGGKASGGVALALESLLGDDDRLEGGVVVTSSPVETDRVAVLEGDHPTPSERNVEGTRRALEAARDADDRTLVLAPITGGASALWCAPAAGLSLADLQATTDALLASGATIDEINAVRKHCSAIKGGHLAREAAPATVVALAISDVVGDPPSVIGSGPTVPDATTFADALAVCARYRLEDELPSPVWERLERGADRDVSAAAASDLGIEETPDEGHPAFESTDWQLLANGSTAIDAAREAARERGYEPLVLSSRLQGEAREVGRVHAAIAAEIEATGQPLEPPAVVLSGGEVTVTVRGDGTGGPNQELALAAALELGETDTDAVLASVDTDGIDGPTDACGAIVDVGTVRNAGEARDALAANDVYDALERWGALLKPGYTGTNVNDLRVLVLE